MVTQGSRARRHRDGEGVPQNYKEAIQWFDKDGDVEEDYYYVRR